MNDHYSVFGWIAAARLEYVNTYTNPRPDHRDPSTTMATRMQEALLVTKLVWADRALLAWVTGLMYRISIMI